MKLFNICTPHVHIYPAGILARECDIYEDRVLLSVCIYFDSFV